MFWLKRLHEIQEAKEAGEKSLEEYGMSVTPLNSWLKRLRSKRTYKIGWNHQDKHFLCLKKLENEDPKENDDDK